MVLTVGTDSYASVADASAYASDMGLTFSGDAFAMEAALRRATRWVDVTYRARFPGSRTDGRSQALEWPRADAKDTSGNEIADDEIPGEIQDATIEAAVREIASPGSLLPDVTPGQAKVLTQVDSIQWKATGTSGAEAQKPILHVVEGILAPLIGGKTNRLLRA